MWLLRGRVVDSDSSALENNAVQLLDTPRGVLDRPHGDEAETP